jgi:hypothetical protein
MPCCALITTVYGRRAPDPAPAMASQKPEAQRRQARCRFAYHVAACTCEGLRVVSPPALLAPRGVPRTLAHRPDTRAPEVFGAPRVRSASPLRGLLYAFWRRRSRLASARGGAHIDILHSVVEPPILCVRSLEGLHPKAPHPISVPKIVTPRGAQVAPVTPPAPPPSLRH